MNKLTTGVVALALMALSSSTGFAQAPDSGPGTTKGGAFVNGHQDRLDINGDGKIGWRERQAGKRAKRGMDARASRGNGQGKGRGGQAVRRREHVRERFDADGNGKLDEAERGVAREALRAKAGERRQERIAQVRRHVDRDGSGNFGRRERDAVRMQGARRRQAAPARSRFFDKESAPRMQRPRARGQDSARGQGGREARRGAHGTRNGGMRRHEMHRQGQARSEGRRGARHGADSGRSQRGATRARGRDQQRGQRGGRRPARRGEGPRSRGTV